MTTPLIDLEPHFLVISGDGTWAMSAGSPVMKDGLMFTCPKCRNHQVICWFAHVGQDVNPKPGRWDVWGTSFEDVSLRPSVNLTGPGCGWHGFVGGGQVSIL